MAMIFPGMDPYLEEPHIWPGVHSTLVVYIRDQLQPVLRPRYIAAVEERVFVEGPDREILPDVWLRQSQRLQSEAVALADADTAEIVEAPPSQEIHESYINILDRQSGQNVVTTIEVVSPTNKFAGPGRRLYESKQREVLESATHLVEIDLLRTGPHVLAVPERQARGKGPYDYLVCVNRAYDLRTRYEVYRRRLRALPRVRIPLAGDDPDVVLDVQAVVDETYERGLYADRLNYDAPCQPLLNSEDEAWATQMIQEARSRSESPT